MLSSPLARCLVVIGALLLVPPAVAAPGSPVRTMMEASGLVDQLAEMGKSSRAGMLAGGAQAGLPPDFALALADAYGRAMEPTRLADDLETHLDETLSNDEILAITEFYRSPLGLKMKAAEVAASSDDVRVEIEQHRGELQKALEGDPARLAIVERIDKALLASEVSATTVMSLMHAIIVAGLGSQSPAPTPGQLAAAETRIAGTHDHLVQKLREDLRATFQRTYRDISTEDLDAYADFLETEKARAVYAGFSEALAGVLQQRGQEIGEEIAAFAKQKKS